MDVVYYSPRKKHVPCSGRSGNRSHSWHTHEIFWPVLDDFSEHYKNTVYQPSGYFFKYVPKATARLNSRPHSSLQQSLPISVAFSHQNKVTHLLLVIKWQIQHHMSTLNPTALEPPVSVLGTHLDFKLLLLLSSTFWYKKINYSVKDKQLGYFFLFILRILRFVCSFCFWLRGQILQAMKWLPNLIWMAFSWQRVCYQQMPNTLGILYLYHLGE